MINVSADSLDEEKNNQDKEQTANPEAPADGQKHQQNKNCSADDQYQHIFLTRSIAAICKISRSLAGLSKALIHCGGWSVTQQISIVIINRETPARGQLGPH